MPSQSNNQTIANTFVITVTSRDRVGIVRDLTSTLSRLNANVERVAQTVVMNYFTLTLVVTFPESHNVAEIRELLKATGAPGEFEIGVVPFEPGSEQKPAVKNADSFVLTATGEDRPGILDQLVNYLAGKGINILDLYVHKPKHDRFVLISQLAVPQTMDTHQIRLDVEAMGKKINMTVALQHENIFRATNELTPPATFSGN